MSAPRVLVTDYTWADTAIERAILAEVGAEVIEAPDASESTLVELAVGAAAILTCFAQVTPAVLAAAGDALRVVARYGVGLDNIAVDEATRLGVPVTNVPVYCVDEVAEHTLALLFALERGLVVHDRGVHEGDWRLRSDLGARRIRGRTIGVIGGGRIGSAVAERCRALGIDVLVGDARAAEHDRRSLHDLVSRCDYVSLHVPLVPATRHLVDESFLRAMRPDAFLLNTARGGVVDTDALDRALAEGWIAGAGIDVFDPEVLPADHPLLTRPNLIATPHTAFFSLESMEALAHQAATSVADVLAGRRPEHVVNGIRIG